MTKRKVQISTGYILNCEFSALGGVTYQRAGLREEPMGKNGVESEFNTIKRVDNVDLHKESKSILGAAYYVMDKNTVSTALGYFVTLEGLPTVENALHPVRQAAAAFNEMAEVLGSARRVTIEIYPIELAVDNERAAKRLAQTVRERLRDIHDALRIGDRRAFEKAMDEARNLEKLATGIHADAIRLALDLAKERKTDLLEALRSGGDPVLVGGRLDLAAIVAAMGLFNENPAEVENERRV